MTTTTMTKIVCGECRHENEAERIYCHNCGERLDRSAAAAQKPIVDPTETHRRLQKMLGPPSRVRHNFFAVSKLVLAAVAAGAVVETALPPELRAPTRIASPPLDFALENAHLRDNALACSQSQA